MTRPVDVYDANYYRTGCGPVPYERTPGWIATFAAIADNLVRAFRPSTVLDAGCAMGMLVEALWDRGIVTHGVDISEYAIANVRPDMAPYCRVGSLTEPLGGPYDLVTCIEVLEHIPRADAGLVFDRLCEASDTIVFSSTPIDFVEPTHVNVCPPIVWLREFADRGFAPDLVIDGSFVSPQAFVVRRSTERPDDRVLELVANRIRLALELAELSPLPARLAAAAGEIDELRKHYEAATSEREDLRAHYEAAISERDDLRAGYEAAISERDDLRARCESAIRERESLREHLAEASAHHAAALRDRERLLEEDGRVRAELDALHRHHTAALAERDAMSVQIRELVERSRADLDEARGAIMRANADLRALKDAHIALVAKYEALRERTYEHLEGDVAATDQLIDALEQSIAATQASAFWRAKLRLRGSR